MEKPGKTTPCAWLAGCVLALLAPAAWAADAADPASVPAGSMEVVARFDGPGPSGIAVTPGGRVFVGFPRHAENHAGMTLGEVVDGRLLPFPDAATSLPSRAAYAQWLVSVHGMTTDARGNLWVIDDGKRAGIDGIPDGAAKVVGFDPDTRRTIASVVLEAPALLQDSHMNDLRVDLSHGARGTAYISDSSFGTAPALVVVDLASGRQRRVLGDHVSTRPEPGLLAILDGKPMRYDARAGHPLPSRSRRSCARAGQGRGRKWTCVHARAMTQPRVRAGAALRVGSAGPPAGAARLDLTASQARRHAAPPDGPADPTRPTRQWMTGPSHPTFPVGGADAITLSADSQTLYYAPLTSRRLYSIPTAVLADFGNDEATLAAAVTDLGEKGFADGMATDPQGRLYITDGEHDAILRRWPDGRFDVVVRDPRIVWPDGIYATATHVYVTLGQWDRLPGFNQGRDLRQPPYLLVRAPIEPAPTLTAATASP
ncbi:major royal jelly family protein [Stenotrophomonas sp. MMGLT7]|uniref:major royal jelly family protein n=1 Tax=Stenotrophomonas sp. MMGLT7 TaxID=2901227 RepID=UPI001E64BB78|nr:major royal jelly family protein [Stenotrophomonas sp. MMGLT7]MCD7098471.1 major royal jelly family protein [Stenotrophomonas sp. MMGLT7]